MSKETDNTPSDDVEAPVRHSLAGRLRTYFLTGLIVAGPVAITIYLTWSFINWVDDLVRPLVPVMYRPETYLPFPIPGSGLVVAVFALTLLGFLTANLIGRTVLEIGEMILGRMPIVRAIYRSLKQVFETLFSGKESSFRKVGLVEFPSPGMWSIVLISQPPSPQVSTRLPGREEHISVFLLCAQERGDRGRHDRRAGGDADHVGGRRAAGQQRQEERRGAGRPRQPGAGCTAERGQG
jgi:uncharacterized membrane protein